MKLGFDTAPQPEAKGFTINPNVGNVDLSAMSKPVEDDARGFVDEDEDEI